MKIILVLLGLLAISLFIAITIGVIIVWTNKK